MYNDWQVINVNQLFEENRWSVVHKLPSINGQNVVNEVVKPLATSLNNNNQFVTNIGSSNNLNSTFINNNLQATTSNFTTLNEQFKDENETNKEEMCLQNSKNLTTTSSDLNDYTYYLKTDRDVQWVMEVICYGLGLPISTTEHYETVRDCVHIYCEWMYALISTKSQTKLIPYPIRDDPNHYFKRILQHLYNIFVPRISSVYTLHNISSSIELNMTDIISKQALLCHRILRTISTITQDETNLMDGDTWDNLLLFLLAINDVLLAQPGEREDIGTHLCERVITVLFEIWIMACKKCFPTPNYWKTLQHLLSTWRHRPQVIEQWSTVCLVFTQRLVQINNQTIYSGIQQEGHTKNSDTDIQLNQQISSNTFSSYINNLIQEMDYSLVSQSWYRFLLIINNPVDLSSPEIISKTKKFSNFATECVVDPRQHPCLDLLPQNFYKAMKGIAQLVDTFLGISFIVNENFKELNKSISVIDGSNISSNSAINLANEKINVVTPPNSRKIKNISKHTILGGLQAVNKNSSNVSHPVNNLPNNPQNLVSVPFSVSNCTMKQLKYSPYRPKVNSILKIFGKWLFNAALLNNSNQSDESINNEIENSGSTSSFSSLNNQNFSSNDTNWNRRNSNERVSLEIPLALLPENFEAGVAEAIGILSRLFSSKQSDEEISPIYYARFFEALKLGLSKKEPIRNQVLSSILINGTQLFKLNLSGIDILIPDFLKAFEIFIFEKEQSKSKFFFTNIIDLRRACIKIMLSLLCYPLHFNELPIKDCLTDSQSCISFRSLKPNLVSLMLNALHSEKDSLNLQMVLGGLIILLEDTFAFDCEEVLNDVKNTNSKKPKDNTSNHSSDDSYSLYTVILNSTCHLLMTQKKNDTQVSLAALEVLSQLARIHLNNINTDEIKKATKCICNYIVNQCSRPPPHHSKDMHSTLVAAFQCLSTWFSEHSYLLKDDTCINTLLEVIELGISGSKSINFEIPNLSASNNSLKNSSNKDLNKTVIFKTFKELKPASMRVQESAEFLFNCFINQFGCTPSSPCPPECVTGCCDLNELSLLKLIKNDTSLKNHDNLTFEDACKNFKYFVSENTILIGFLNNPKNQNCYCLVRSPFGKFCWKMNFQLTADSFNGFSDYSEVSRPKNYFNFIPKNFPTPKNFPSSISKIPLTNIENSIPTLKQIYNKYSQQQQNLNQMFKIVASQKVTEKNLKQNCFNDLKNHKFECKKPLPPKIDDFDSARLIINHLGLMNLEKNRLSSLNSTQLINLDLNNIELFNYISSLDSLPLRTCDTSFIFYVRKGRVHPQEILNSVCSINYVKPSFLEFLYSLGNPINCKQHYGWTGNLFTSWKGNLNESESFSQDTHLYAEHGGSIFDGKKMSIYWADIAHELAFIIPSQGFEDEMIRSCNNENQVFTNNPSACSQSGITVNSSLGSAISTNTEEKSFQRQTNPEQRSISSFSDETISVASHNPSENSSSYRYNNSSSINNSNSINNDMNQRKKRKQDFHTNIGCDIKVLIIWLENSEDEYSLPIETLMMTTNTGVEKNKIKDYIAILIHPLKNGLFTTKIISSQDKIPMALPIMDGIVINKRILGLFVRLTTLNIYKRRRLDMDNFQLPHVKRRVKIQELSKKFKLQGKEVEFYNSLF